MRLENLLNREQLLEATPGLTASMLKHLDLWSEHNGWARVRVRLGPRTIRYDRAAAEKWLEERKERPARVPRSDGTLSLVR